MRNIGIVALILVLSACSTGNPNPAQTPSNTLGLLKVTITGIGDGATPNATAEWVKGGVGGQSAAVVPVNGTNALNDVQISRRAVNFSDDDSTNTRYVYSTFNLTNRTSTNFANLTLYAVNVPTNIGGTAIAGMTAATGTAITSEGIARGFQPIHAIRPTLTSVKVNEDLADLYLLSPAEASDIKTQAVNQSILTNAATVLEYGFVARNLSGGRSIAARDSATLPACNTNACKGAVTLAYKFPKVSPRQNNPFAFTLYFVVANESNSYVSQSLDEQSLNTVAGLASTSSFLQTRTLSGSSFATAGETLNNLCQAKTAVSTVANPSNILMPATIPTTPGSLDTCFWLGGKRTMDFGPGNDRAYALALQSDGKLVVAGDANYDFALARYNPDGSLDTAFDGDGKVTTNIASYDHAAAMTLQSDGKIVVAGSSFNGADYDFALARYNPNGSLDTNFGTGGKVSTPIGSSHERANALAIQNDGKIVLAGESYILGRYYFALARYNPDGSLDTTFDGDGKVTTALVSDTAYSVAIQSDGKIVAAGMGYNGSNFEFALVRYNSNGSPDTTFGTGGKVATTFGPFYNQANAIAIQSDGKIVAVGYSEVGGTSVFALARYNTDGSLDTTFGTGGKVTTPIDTAYDMAYALAFQSDGKIVVAGTTAVGSANSDFLLARYNPNGSLDTTFHGDGKLAMDFGSGRDGAYALAIQSNGKIVVAGYISNGSNEDFALVRYNP